MNTNAQIGLIAVALAAAAPHSLAQSLPSVQSADRTVRHAGTYHVASGTWSRSAVPAAAFGASALETVYSNTASSGYFFPFNATGSGDPGGWTFDEGGLPGTANPDHGSHPSARNEYFISGFQIGYCDTNPAGTSGWEIAFYDGYAPSQPNEVPKATVTVTGLPAAGCWTVDIDLSGGGEFMMAADGGASNPGWDGVPSEDQFSWSIHYAGSDGTQPAGFMLTGHPEATDPNWSAASGVAVAATGTVFQPSLQCTPGQDGYGTTGYLGWDRLFFQEPPQGGIYGNDFWHSLGPYNPQGGCGFGVGRNPWASYHLELYSDPDGGTQRIGQTYCLSNPNSSGQNGTLEMYGSNVAVDDRVELRAANLPVQVVGFFLTSETAGSVSNPAGSAGNLCLGGSIGRFVGPGQIKSSGGGTTASLDTAQGEWSLTAIPGPTTSYAAVTGLTSHFQFWHRDSSSSGPTSNFTDGASVTWQ